MLTTERLFQGETTAEILEQVIAGHPPSPRAHNPDIPDDVMTILRRALQRDPARRYASAGEMGQACEHYLYDKGYGPTNLTLKQCLSTLFPESQAAPVSPEPSGLFPAVDATLIPIGDGLRPDRSQMPGEDTPVSPLSRPYRNSETSAPAAAPLTMATLPPETLAPDPQRPRRKLKPRRRE
jgi:serine/threonine protein kinase